MYQMSQTFPQVPGGPALFQVDPDCSRGSWKGLDITGQFWRCLDGSGGSNSSSEAGMCWLASPVGARLA